MRPTIALATVLIAVPLTGCGLDIVEGKKSDFQIAQERRAALTLPAPIVIAETRPVPAIAPVVIAETPRVPDVVSAPEPAIVVPVRAVEPEPAPVVSAAPTVCTPIFRILSCDDDGNEVWL